jgi:mannosyl-oligosaccharide glucosidase
VWINLNYLALRALYRLGKAKGPYQAQAGEMYAELRANVLGTILGQYKDTGFFWEQYDDSTGKGLRTHPFTGWTTLVVSIMAEEY